MPEQTAQKHGYELISQFPASPGSEFVVHVKNSQEHYILKSSRKDKEAYSHEAKTLLAWRDTGAAVHLVDEPEPGVLVIEYIEGHTVQQEEGGVAKYGQDVGKLARRLHIPAPQGTRTLREHLQHDWEVWLKDNPLVDEDLKAMAYGCMTDMVNADVPQVLLHGDLRSTNIMCRRDGSLVAIDPYGLSGPGDFDLGYYVVCSSSENRRQLMRDVAKGYGQDTPSELLADSFAWNCILTLAYYIESQLPFDGLHLEVAQLKELGCPQAFLDS
jgi:streptomycin 6-kinase